MFCSKCGNEFEGQFCSGCGAAASAPNAQPSIEATPVAPPYQPSAVKEKKKKGGCLKFGLIAIACVFGIGIISSLLGPKNAPVSSGSKAPSSKAEIQAIAITAEELLNSYKENEVSADNQYKNKVLEVSGVVKTVGKDIMDEPYVTLGTDNEFEIISVQCYFKDPAELDKVANLKPGEEITIVGTCSGSSINVLLKKCIIK